LASVVVFSGTIVLALDSDSKKSVTNNFRPAEVSIGVVEDPKSTQPVTEKDYTLELDDDKVLSVDKPVEVLNVDATNPSSADVFIRATIVPMWVTDSSDSDGNTQNFVVGAMDGIIDDSTNKRIYAEDDDDDSYKYVGDNDKEYLDISPFDDLTTISIGEDNSYTLGDVTFTLVKDWDKYWVFNQNDGYFYYKYVVPVGEKTTQLLQSVSIADTDLYRYSNDPITLRVDVLADSVQALGGAFDSVWTDVGLTRSNETVEEGETTHKYGYVLETAAEDS
jgi:hypothetical protein